MNPFDNLIPFDQMTEERHKELSAKGGRASGSARKHKAELRDVITEYMCMEYLKEAVADEAMKTIDIVIARQRRRKRERERRRKKRE